MKTRWLLLVSISLVAFTGLVVAWQFQHYDRETALQEWVKHGRRSNRDNGIISSLAQSCLRWRQLAITADIVKRDELIVPASGLCRYIDLALPKDARVFMMDMTGPTNYSKIGNYFFATYHLFPRKVGVSIDQPTCLTKDGFLGRTAESDHELLTNGYDAIIDFPPDETLTLRLLRPMREVPIKEPINPDWFSSKSDATLAFLLPLLTALTGMWLFRFLFPTLSGVMPLLEQLACGLGLGMMAIAALTLGVKLCGFHARGLIFFLTAAGGIAEIWRDRHSFLTGLAGGFRKAIRSPVAVVILAAGLIVFVILFGLAGLQGLVDPDATRWLIKAKIIHLYTGKEIAQWFSNPALSYAHLDYPTLVPALHAATYDTIGHVDEFVTKFWPAWMLLFLLGALASLNLRGSHRFYAPLFALLGLLLLPATQKYVQMEGATLPMVFFTVLGFVECALWLVERNPARLALGLTILFGAAMAKLEGFIFLALVGSWMVLVPSARPRLRPLPRLWRMLAFWLLSALPFVCLRVQIPVLHFESGWTGYAMHSPGTMLSNWPGIFMILLARLFVNPDFASWNGDGGQLHWTGQWDGVSSLYNNYSTLGLAWLCLWMTAALWFAVPDQRRAVLWLLVMLVGAIAAFSLVFASFVSITSLTGVISFTVDDVAGRYLFPVLLAWFATLMTMLFANDSSSGAAPVPTTDPAPTVPVPPGKAETRPDRCLIQPTQPANRALSTRLSGGPCTCTD